MVERELDIVLKEHFDTSDRRTMKTLLSLNEADQNQAMAALASKLYEKIVAKVDDIDFGTIPASKGDITKIGNFQEMRDCLDTIRNILVHFKQDTCQLDIIDKAIENVKDSKKIWEKAFAIECELPMTFYNTITLSIVSSISLLISSSIDFITNNNGSKSFEISFDKVAYTKTKDKLLFQNLDKFNKAYAKGDIEKLMNSVNKSNASLKESATGDMVNEVAFTFAGVATAISAGVIIGSLLLLVLPILHALVSALYCLKQNVADYFEVQAKVVQFNAESLKYDYTKSEAEIQKIYEKQTKIATKFRNIADKLSVKMNKADNDAKKQIEQDKKEKYKLEDLDNNDVPGLSSGLF